MLAAHCVHLDDADLDLWQVHDVAVAHARPATPSWPAAWPRCGRCSTVASGSGWGPTARRPTTAWTCSPTPRLAASLARLAGRSTTALHRAEAFRLAAGGAADAVGRPDWGSWRSGGGPTSCTSTPATWCSCRSATPGICWRTWCGPAAVAIRDVWVGGRPVVRDGVSATVDTEALRADVAARAARLARRLRDLAKFFNQAVDYTAGRVLTFFLNRKVEYEEDDVAADPLSRVFSALADPTRRDIVARLAVGDATVNELAEPYDVTVQAVSKHLKVLEDAGLVSRTGRPSAARCTSKRRSST